MLYRKTALRAAAPVAVLALALTACGGGDDKKSDDNAKSDAASSQAKPKEAPALAAGESTTGKVKEGDGTVTYDVAAEKVDLATEAETKKLVSDPKRAEGLVAATAHLKYTHKGGAPLTDTPDAPDTTEIYADGARGGLLIGAAEDAAGCEDKLDLEGWKKGESHVLCETYLVPAGAKSLEVHWAEKDGADPAVWKLPAK
ncbi:hypothetical protein [Streptomyces silaceus]|uniref:hypothetical protein n=1 Tax=Streptomyces silaceus TaxID=545123 RepID=UPI0006EB8068|nr:hypothetical protein [Streptomyces silaceus]